MKAFAAASVAITVALGGCGGASTLVAETVVGGGALTGDSPGCCKTSGDTVRSRRDGGHRPLHHCLCCSPAFWRWIGRSGGERP